MSAPTIGATMNTQSWASASPPPKIAVAIERAGLSDALLIGIATRWNSVSDEADRDRREPAGSAAVGDAEDDPHEERGDHDLGDEHRRRGRSRRASARRSRWRRSRRPAASARKPSLPDGDREQHEGRERATEDLRDGVGSDIPPGEATGCRGTDAHRRVEVSARDVADRVGGRDDRETDREGDREQRRSSAPRTAPCRSTPNTSTKVPNNSAMSRLVRDGAASTVSAMSTPGLRTSAMR